MSSEELEIGSSLKGRGGGQINPDTSSPWQSSNLLSVIISNSSKRGEKVGVDDEEFFIGSSWRGKKDNLVRWEQET